MPSTRPGCLAIGPQGGGGLMCSLRPRSRLPRVVQFLSRPTSQCFPRPALRHARLLQRMLPPSLLGAPARPDARLESARLTDWLPVVSIRQKPLAKGRRPPHPPRSSRAGLAHVPVCRRPPPVPADAQSPPVAPPP